MALLGWSPPDAEERFTLDEAAKQFDFARVNKAGARFDWDKLNWLNSQVLHELSPETLLEQLIPYWQEAGYEFDVESDRPWLLQVAAVVGASLTVLPDAVEMSRPLFTQSVDYDEKAQQQLAMEQVPETLAAVRDKLGESAELTEATAKDIIKQVTKELKVKKGLVMKSLRAALTGAVQGPDLIQSWLILNARGLDRQRLDQAINH